jgi:hypothetical protein
MERFEPSIEDCLTPAALPPGLGDRIVAAAMKDFRHRKIRRVVVRSSAFVILIAGVLTIAFWNRPQPNPVNFERNELASRPILNPISETNKTLTKALKIDLPPLKLPDIASVEFKLPLPTVEPVVAFQDRAKASMRPVSDGVSRAASRWTKDFNTAFGLPKPRM